MSNGNHIAIESRKRFVQNTITIWKLLSHHLPTNNNNNNNNNNNSNYIQNNNQNNSINVLLLSFTSVEVETHAFMRRMNSKYLYLSSLDLIHLDTGQRISMRKYFPKGIYFPYVYVYID